MTHEKLLIYDQTYPELEKQLTTLGQPKYRAGQIWRGLYKNFAADFDEITTLSKLLREKLAQTYTFQALTPIKSIKSKDGRTIKTLFNLYDDHQIEAVLMIYDDRRTLCISTQSGCGLGCVFCATGQMGFARNLTSGEMVAQVLHFARYLAKVDELVTNVVLMGMGEPFLNYEHVMVAIARLNDPDGFELGARRMTVSTVGLVPQIIKFADAGTQVNLAISLHAVDDHLRTQLMPINKKYPVARVLEACRYYIEKTNRRVTFEYALIEGMNDSREDALGLAKHLKGLLCHVNLIPLNPTKGFDKPGSSSDRVGAFYDVLSERHIPCTIRLRRGIEIQAGCGQLAAEG